MKSLTEVAEFVRIPGCGLPAIWRNSYEFRYGYHNFGNRRNFPPAANV